MADERPCKRSRIEDVSEQPSEHPSGAQAAPRVIQGPTAEPLKRDEDIWFPSGNITIIADGRVAFRVFQGILSQRSEAFRGLFDLPLPPDCEKLDDCPVVHLSDSPTDLKHLLLVIYCRKNYFYRRDEPIPVPFHILASLIRMSHKYGVQDLYNTALARLKKFYTSDFDAWDDKKARRRYVTTTAADALTVLELARLTNTPSLLPTAYLICCSLDKARRVKKRTRHERPLLAELSPWDLKHVVTGKAKLAQRRAARLLGLLRAAPCEGCSRPEKCAYAVQRTLQRIDLAELEQGMDDALAFDHLFGWFWTRGQVERLCGRCMTASDEAHTKLRLETWYKLPEIFGIEVPGWPTGTATDVSEEAEALVEVEAPAE
ncbi:hypothetical protein BV20DRAFT_973566 [Pilatotrama ljubarskyi]|nr:hypothetical protein BV20DRAFT_973566 [Pilatotrama ljubarskyi]